MTQSTVLKQHFHHPPCDVIITLKENPDPTEHLVLPALCPVTAPSSVPPQTLYRWNQALCELWCLACLTTPYTGQMPCILLPSVAGIQSLSV